MIVPETLLGDIFSQIPDITYTDVNKGASTIKVQYDWGDQDDMNLYMKQTEGNATPLIWYSGSVISRIADVQDIKLMVLIAKSSENKTAMNRKVWRDEFEPVLDPLLEKVRIALDRSGKTQIMGDSDRVDRKANYSEYLRDENGKKTHTKTIDHWNVIIFECDLKILGDAYCVGEINFY